MDDDPLRLDDGGFDQFVEQARALIPRFAPQWTDHNLHDPGMTLLEMLAWIVDQQIYQLGFVGDRHLVAFAALLGVKPKAVQPARGLIWPNKQCSTENQHVVSLSSDLKRGAAVTTLQQPDLSFVLDADVHLTAAQPLPTDYAQIISSAGRTDLTQIFLQPEVSFELMPQNQDEYKFQFYFNQSLVEDSDFPISLGIEIKTPQSTWSDQTAPWGPLIIEYKTGDSPWLQVTVLEDRTNSLTRTGIVLMEMPDTQSVGPSILRLRLDRGYFPVPIMIGRVEINVLPVVQLESMPQKLLGRSNASPDQTFALDLHGLIEQSQDLQINKPKQNRFNFLPTIQVEN